MEEPDRNDGIVRVEIQLEIAKLPFHPKWTVMLDPIRVISFPIDAQKELHFECHTDWNRSREMKMNCGRSLLHDRLSRDSMQPSKGLQIVILS
jgi:hypothetical protein